VAQLCARQDEFNSAHTRVVIVSFGTLPAVQKWLQETCSPFEVLLDREREVYRAYQLERSLWRAWHPRALWLYFNRWIKRETFYDAHGDDTSQLGGDFIIDRQGVLRLVYPSRDSTDRPPVDDLLAVIQSL